MKWKQEIIYNNLKFKYSNNVNYLLAININLSLSKITKLLCLLIIIYKLKNKIEKEKYNYNDDVVLISNYGSYITGIYCFRTTRYISNHETNSLISIKVIKANLYYDNNIEIIYSR